MYNERPTMSKKKKLELLGGILLLVWLLFLMINYFRYTNGKTPILTIHRTQKYSDGTVESYYGLFYTYRSYRRTSITGEEFVPFWTPKQNPKPITDIPETYKDYEVPNNQMHADKFRGLLYFYGRRTSLLGTYKCINTDIDCEKAISGHDEYDITYSNPLTKPDKRYQILESYEAYAFIDDSEPQQVEYPAPTYKRTIYFFDIKNNKILARFGDVKGIDYNSIFDKLESKDEVYIVKDYKTNKWGIIQVAEDGSIEQKLPYEYDSINFDEDTKYYIVKKDDMWSVYDLKKDVTITDNYTDIIYDVWTNRNRTTYVAVGKQHIIGEYKYIDYKIYRADGQPFLTDDDIVGYYPRENYMFYIKRSTNKLYFIDYAKNVKAEYQLYFAETENTKKHKPCVEIEAVKENYIRIKIYKSSDPNAQYESGYETVKYW